MFHRSNGNSAREMFLPGDLVEVRSASDVLSTLDEKGTLESLPFMPEMLAFCGRQFRVSRQAFKTCVDDREMRRLEDTVFLEDVRCDGASHGGCARACLVFWKTAWLKRAGSASLTSDSKAELSAADLVSLATHDGQFFCQSSEIVNASKPLPWWHAKQYLWDLKYNRIPLLQFAQSLFIAIYNKIGPRLGMGSWKAVAGSGTARFVAQPLNLRPGEFVRVKSLDQIKCTLDPEGKHQNLLFAPAMADFSGRVLRVRDRVENIVLEGTTRQRKIHDTVLLEGATCDGICHRMCPRQSLLFWRECWLERVKAA
ncbi:MAG TPA: hypothetical protein VHE60_12370 [Pyrinomonadaceae bacterium]|nr:hypothetical protein [Pyrinomonadaceae bacterium]